MPRPNPARTQAFAVMTIERQAVFSSRMFKAVRSRLISAGFLHCNNAGVPTCVTRRLGYKKGGVTRIRVLARIE